MTRSLSLRINVSHFISDSMKNFNLCRAESRSIFYTISRQSVSDLLPATVKLFILLTLIFTGQEAITAQGIINDQKNVETYLWLTDFTGGDENGGPEPFYKVAARTTGPYNNASNCTASNFINFGVCRTELSGVGDNTFYTLQGISINAPTDHAYTTFVFYEDDGSDDCIPDLPTELSSLECADNSLYLPGVLPCWSSQYGITDNEATVGFGTSWRYKSGDEFSDPLDFGSLTSGTTYTNDNAIRSSKTDVNPNNNAQFYTYNATHLGYSNTNGAAPSQDVFYSFTLTDAMDVTISTNHAKTNFDTYLTLFNSGGTVIASDDNSGNNSGPGDKSIITTSLCPGTYKIMVDQSFGLLAPPTQSITPGDFRLTVQGTSQALDPGSIDIAGTGTTTETYFECTEIPNLNSVSLGSSGIAGGITYEWERKVGTGAWTMIFGIAGASYDPVDIMTFNDLYFRRVTIDLCGRRTYSNEISFIHDPYDVDPGAIYPGVNNTYNACTGSPLPTMPSVTDASSVNGSITYSWYEWNGSFYELIPSATGSTYTPPGVMGSVNRFIYRQASDGCRSAISGTAAIVPQAPSIEVGSIAFNGPSSVGINLAHSTTITSVTDASSSPNQAIIWQKSEFIDGADFGPWTDIFGETGQTYAIPAIPSKTKFRRVVTNTCPDTLISNELLLDVICEAGPIVYVDQNVSFSANLGSSWANAFTSLQEGIYYASTCPSITDIYVAQGTYLPSKKVGGTTDRHKTFYIDANVKIFGGFAPSMGIDQFNERDGAAYPTILSGDMDFNDTNVDGIVECADDIFTSEFLPQKNAYRVVWLDHVTNQTVLDGLVITAGLEDGGSLGGTGGGIYNDGSGTGLSSSPVISNTLIVGNAANYGGGIYNNAEDGSVNINYTHVEFRGNKAFNDGGGIFNNGQDGTITSLCSDCHFAKNKAVNGGAVYSEGELGTVSTEYLQATFYKNNADVGNGGAVYNNICNTPNGVTFRQASFSENTPQDVYNESSLVTYDNSILWGGTSTAVTDMSSTSTFQNSIVRGGINDMDPQFKAQSFNTGTKIGGYLQLNVGGFPFDTLCSPAIDFGDNALISGITQDVLGNARILDGRPGGNPGAMPDGTEPTVDLGPYEVADPLSFTASTNASDAWIDLAWSLDIDNCDCLQEHSSNQGVQVALVDASDGSIVWFDEVFSVNYDPMLGQMYTGTYRDWVGPGQTVNYWLWFRRIGDGNFNCHQSATGTTTAFNIPTNLVATDALYTDSVGISWTSNSWLADSFHIYRDNFVIDKIDGLQDPGGNYTSSDVYRFDDMTSLVNGQIYTYKIATIPPTLRKGSPVLSQAQDAGSTLDIGLVASDNTPVDRVVLTWNNMQTHSDEIRIVRDGQTIGVVANSATTFTDLEPIFGQTNLYGVELLRNGQPYVGSYDNGSTLPNGVINGAVLSHIKQFPISGVTVDLAYANAPTIIIDTKVTGFDGNFSFTDISYGLADTFLLKATYPSGSFTENPVQAVLNLSASTQDGAFIFETSAYQTDGPLTTLQTFTATPIPAEDKMQLDWSFTPTSGMVTYFNIFRNNTLIKRLNDNTTTSYVDLAGVPGEEYEYRLSAFRIDGSMAYDTSLSLTATFPIVAPVAVLTPAPNGTLGLVDLNWAHTSTNNAGFRLYRNGQRIYEGTDMMYADKGGRPGQTEEYYLTSYRRVNDISYESAFTNNQFVLYPDLPDVTNMNPASVAGEDVVRIGWTVPVVLTSTYNYSGFNVYRYDIGVDTVLINTIDRAFVTPGSNLVVTDRTGIPGKLYQYEVRTFLKTATVDQESDGNRVSQTFPVVSVPLTLTDAVDQGKITLNWQSPHTSTNYDGFEIRKGSPLLVAGEIGAQYTNTYTDYVTNPFTSTAVNYEVRTFRIVGDTKYYSVGSTISSGPPTAGNLPRELTNVTATRDQANHIKTCWMWDELLAAATPNFVILREGVVLDTLPPTARAYYDYGAPVGMDVEYSVYAYVDGAFTTQQIYALGHIPSKKTISGRIYKQNSGQGRSGIEVIAMSATQGYQAVTLTDESGYYEINNIPLAAANYNVTMTADETNASYVTNPQTVQITPDMTDKTVDFVDTYILAPTDMDVAQIESITATPQPADLSVVINWSPTNENYTGFEVYRGAKLLGEVVKGNELMWEDFGGEHGMLTLYYAKAYLIIDGVKTFSDAGNASTLFPKLEPVQNLTLTPFEAQNKVVIQWSHPYDSHDHYRVERNGQLMGLVSTSSDTMIVPMTLVDTTGAPGAMHNYSVTAYKGRFKSEEVSDTLQYPELFRLTTLTVTVPLDTANENSTMNHTFLSWTYEDKAADAFAIIRYERDGGNVKFGEKLLDRIDGGLRTYKDYTGTPGITYHYVVLAVAQRNGLEYFSARRDPTPGFFASLVYPIIGFAKDRSVVADTAKGWMELSFRYPYPTVDSLVVYRQGQATPVGILKNNEFSIGEPITVLDKNGVPDDAYVYEVQAYSPRNGAPSGSVKKPFAAAPLYPKIPAVLSFTASDGLYHNKINLDWDYDQEVVIDGFRIMRKLPTALNPLNEYVQLGDDLPGGRRKLSDGAAFGSTQLAMLNGEDVSYKVEAFRDYGIPGERQSLAAIDSGYVYTGRYAPISDAGNHFLGYSTSMYEDWAIVGTSSVGMAYVYKRGPNGAWGLHQMLQAPGDLVSSFGRAVSVYKDFIVVGSNFEEANRGAVYVFKYDVGTDLWVFEQRLTAPDQQPYADFGWSVDIIDEGSKYLIVGAPEDDTNGDRSGKAYIFQRVGNKWDAVSAMPSILTAQTSGLVSDVQAGARYGNSVALGLTSNGTFFASIGAPGYTGASPSGGKVYMRKRTGGNMWATDQTLEGDDAFAANFGTAVDISKDLLIVGEPGESEILSSGGAANIYTYDNTSWTDQEVVRPSDAEAFGFFGQSVTILSDGSDTKAVVGNHQRGRAYLFSPGPFLWEENMIYSIPPGSGFPSNGVLAQFGWSVGLTGTAALVGAPREDNEKGIIAGSVHFYPFGTPPDAPTAVDATDGGSTQVTVDWTHSGAGTDQFKIIRDGQEIGTTPSGTTIYTDDSNDIIPGKEHFYEVVATTNAGLISDPGSDFGSIVANGRIEGSITAPDLTASIGGVSVMAAAEVDGEVFTFGPVTSTTATGANYSIDGIYYGSEAMVTVTPSFMGHSFDPAQRVETLKLSAQPTDHLLTNINFVDSTSYTVSGIIKHDLIADCGIGGVKIQYISVLSNGTRIPTEHFTNDKGAYSIVINPLQDDLDSIIIMVADTQIINGDTIVYNFQPQGTFDGLNPGGMPYFTDFSGMSLATTINYIEQTQHQVDLTIKNTCGAPLNYEFSIRAYTTDGCFQQEVPISAAGIGSVNLPPVDMILTVSDVVTKNNESLRYLEYLMNNPVKLNLRQLSIDTARDMTAAAFQALIATEFTYHLPPQIGVDLSTFDFCGDKYLLDQGTEYTIPLSVTENFPGGQCPVQSGYLKIINDASDDPQPVILPYNVDNTAFPTYVFTAGGPNLIEPHFWNMSIEYFSDEDQFQGKIARTFFVSGETGVPGNGILLDASDGMQEVPIPLYILRDPPGDASFSTIEQGTSITRSVGFSKELGGSGTIKSESEVFFGIAGPVLNVEATLGSSDEDEQVMEITTTTTSAYSTSGSDSFIGKDADVIIGTGIAMQYGTKTQLSYNTCESGLPVVNNDISIGLTPNGIGTTWISTVGEIQKKIDDTELDIAQILSGAKQIKNAKGEVLPIAEAAARFTALRDNYVQILEYHKKETNPFYYMAKRDFTKQNPCTGSAANVWRDNLLTMLDQDNDGEPDLEFTFDSIAMKKYNNAAYAILKLLEITKCLQFGTLSIPTSDISNYTFTTARFNDQNYAFAPKDKMAKNITFFGGPGEIEESYGQTVSNEKTLTSTFYNEDLLETGIKVENEIKTVVGLGVGIIKKITKFETTNTLTGTFSLNETNTSTTINEQENHVSYTLDDENGGDEISVTILRGIDMNHTPYFQTLGGFTSCPPEEGTMSRHNWGIEVLDPVSMTASSSASLRNQQAGQPVDFTLKMTNGSMTNDALAYEVFLDNTSNPNNASLTLSGGNLGTQIFLPLDPMTSEERTLQVTPSTAFDYNGLRVGISPTATCLADVEDRFDAAEYVTLNVDYLTPCSPVSIVQPSDNWLVTGASNSLVITIQDFDLSNLILEDFTLEYRRPAINSEWLFLGNNYLADNNNPVTPDSIAASIMVNPGVVPTYNFVWQLPDDLTTFPDGDYEIRVVAKCKEGAITTRTFSNIVSGKVNRARLQLFGVPEPADGTWITGDIIGAEFNHDLNCTLFDSPNFIANNLSVNVDGVEVTNATFTCLNNAVRMILPDMTIYDGQLMEVTMIGITDENGNVALGTDGASDTIRWDFLVVTSEAYWEQDSIVVEMYEGETLNVIANLTNTDGQSPQPNLTIERTDNGSSAWLAFSGAPFTLQPGQTRPIALTFTSGVAGTYTDILEVAGFGGSSSVPMLPIKVIVYKRPPNPPDWVVDGNLYPNSMTVVASLKYSDELTVSSDTLDQISVYIGNTLRGVATLQLSGSVYVSYITVYGSAADDGKPLDFRVWDSELDIEYDGHPADNETIPFVVDAFRGTSGMPVEIQVDRTNDVARYIPLNQGYTWFSLNTTEADMSPQAILGGLSNPAPGDRLLSSTHFAEYVDATIGWYVQEKLDASNNPLLAELSNTESYMIYLANQADSIRVTGPIAAAPESPIGLAEGWHWIGYPQDGSKSLGNAICVGSVEETDQIKSKDQAAIWTSGSWDGALTQMEPYQGYKIEIHNPSGSTLDYTSCGQSIIEGDGEIFEKPLSKRLVVADPNDAMTWILDPADFNYQDIVPVVGKVTLNGSTATSGKVAAFIGNQLVGLGAVTNDAVLNQTLFTLSIGINNVSELGSVTLHYATTANVEHPVTQSITYVDVNFSGIHTYANPLQITIGSGGDNCTETTLQLDGVIPSDVYHAINTLISGGTINSPSVVEFKAGSSIELDLGFSVGIGAQLEAIIEQCSSSVKEEVKK